MPSPASITTPTSTAASSAPKRSICCLRMDAISSGLTAMSLSPLLSPSEANTHCYLLGRRPALTTSGRRASEFLLQGHQPAPGAAVDQRIAHAGDEAAQDRRVDLRLYTDLLARYLAQPGRYPLDLLVGEGHGRRHRRPGDAAVLVQKRLELQPDLAGERGAALGDEKARQVHGPGADLRQGGGQQGVLLRVGDPHALHGGPPP